MIPTKTLAEHRRDLREIRGKPVNRTAIVVAVWLVLAAPAVNLVAGVVRWHILIPL